MNERDQIVIELNGWLLNVSEGTASAEDTARFNDLLADDASLREYVAGRLIDESLLIEQLQLTAMESFLRGQTTLPQEVTGPASVVSPPITTRRMLQLTAVAACIALACAVPWMLYGTGSVHPSPTIVVTEDGDNEFDAAAFAARDEDAVAILTRSVDVQWAEGQSPLAVDTSLRPDTIRLSKGLIQLEFFSGATVILEGPAELAIESPMRCKLVRGKVRADVPPQARGFTIANNSLDAVDLGTEFAMRVDENGEGEVHVLDGEILLQAPDGKNKRALRVGEAVRHDANGKLADFKAHSESFVDIQELKNLDNTRQAERFQRWQQQSEQWANDPAIVLYYNFQQANHDERRLRSSITGATSSADGAVIGCQWSEGRFAGKGALEFKRTSDRVRVHVPGEFESLSMIVWLRVEGFDQWLSSLLLTDGWDEGETHWQLTREGKIRFGIKDDGSYNSPQVLQASDLGRWVQIATVYDRPSGRVRFYVNGEAVWNPKIRTAMTLRIGDAEIGNWKTSTVSGHLIRSLNGLVDEIAVFSRPLSPREIRSSFEAGNPYQ